jgi:hypothetical protein
MLVVGQDSKPRHYPDVSKVRLRGTETAIWWEAMTPSFTARMAELDAVVAKCAGHAPFETGVVRDASNRSSRDWPWWGVQIEHTEVDGSVSRRATATVTLRSTQSGEPGSYDGEWRAQVWQGSGTDTFRECETRDLGSSTPTPAALQETMSTLLKKAKSVLPGWSGS